MTQYDVYKWPSNMPVVVEASAPIAAARKFYETHKQNAIAVHWWDVAHNVRRYMRFEVLDGKVMTESSARRITKARAGAARFFAQQEAARNEQQRLDALPDSCKQMLAWCKRLDAEADGVQSISSTLQSLASQVRLYAANGKDCKPSLAVTVETYLILLRARVSNIEQLKKDVSS